MKATGMIRRIGDLGKLAIPKEVLRNLKIGEGTPLEIFEIPDGIVLKIYHPETKLTELVEQMKHTLESDSDYVNEKKYQDIWECLLKIEKLLDD